MSKKVIEIHQSGMYKGYKAISKALGLQTTTVRAKWKNSAVHPTTKDNIKGPTSLYCINTGHCSWLQYQKHTGQKWHPWKSESFTITPLTICMKNAFKTHPGHFLQRLWLINPDLFKIKGQP
ncbi:hypothetical protein AMELA_G00053170 [Ameiurus melas]|uniref:Uncharacterized protein n=1 Tax=Ameiurus melas TaxID=219545 RepID=A0A7J6B6Q6_AMEME|nr:hypothetical protein AMELA_G00053170 [Ameiurus melas]